ncbi:TetR family transcriptional regulator [Lysinibacillus alkalisoli]|uniref:TetR family transcriptional regulator n=1 Tax=Lysinibacillus alkalisoli TaxID=1911548 RepID=A0A917LHF6_9BACI|nr:TetR/AcrR family transcriptional regulator [Lysinibacillus alkalisoli]GGG23687.1 TetR family transcriptional regulator [Lysinibacillus alkalisoli]
MNARKRKVIQVALQLFLERGYVQTSIQDIIDQANISKGTFYNYFSSKDDCLIAIIDIAREQTSMLRSELLVGKSPSDKAVLLRQIATGIQYSSNQTILPILESVFQSSNTELKEALRSYHLRELKWLAQRLVDVYGVQIEPFKYDITIMLFGSLQSFQKMWRAASQEPFNIARALRFLFQQLDACIPHIEEGFMTREIEHYMKQYIANEGIDKQELLHALQELLDEQRSLSTESFDLTKGIYEELIKTQPSAAIIRALIPSFANSFRNTSYYNDSATITNLLWRYLEES